MCKIGDTQQPNVDIAVKNFGPIAEASIDLRPLTVFVGPSNTGKTYFATLVYVLHRIFSEFPNFPEQEHGQPPPDTSEAAFREFPPYLKAIEAAFKRSFDVASVSDLIRFPGSDCNRLEVSLKLGEAHQEDSHFTFQAQGRKITINRTLATELMLYPKQNPSDAQCYYLPATRSGIMQSYRLIASSLIAPTVHTDARDSGIPTLSAVVVDFMQHLTLYKARGKSNPEILTIADTLESQMLAGEIVVTDSQRGYSEFHYHPKESGHEVSLGRTSAMVSELAPLVLFLRSGIKPGDTLIIEEPEAHLHPGGQADMAVILARLVRAGVRVIVTTHSDWLLEELGNLILEGELANLGGKTHEPPVFLQKEQVGAWLFQKNGRVAEIEYDRLGGVEPQEYGDVAEERYNRSAELRNQIEELKGDSISG